MLITFIESATALRIHILTLSDCNTLQRSRLGVSGVQIPTQNNANINTVKKCYQ
jgi:hypothetical protein